MLYYKNESNEWLKPVLRSLPNGIKDTIEKHNDGKYYYHKRCGEMTLGNNLDFLAFNDSKENTNYVGVCIPGMKLGNNLPLICNRFNTEVYSESKDYEYIYTWTINSRPLVYIHFLKNKGNSMDAIKQWIHSNNVTIVFELAKEEIYECSPIDLQTFDGTTTLSIESGPICPKTSVSVVSDI